jgi:hypothetical protein
MKLRNLYEGSVAGGVRRSALSRPIPAKPDILPLRYQVPQLTPVGQEDVETTLRAQDMARSTSISDVSNMNAPTPLKAGPGPGL